MKRLLILFVSMIGALFIFSGCSIGKEALDDKLDDLEKVQQIEVTSDEDGRITTIEDELELVRFINALKMESWIMSEVPEDAVVDKKFTLYQSETIKFNHSKDQESDLIRIAGIVTYEDEPYIDVVINKFTLTFKVPEEVAEYLAEYE